jgi:hypothetical protein
MINQPSNPSKSDIEFNAHLKAIHVTLNTMAHAMEAIAKHLDPQFKTAREIEQAKQARHLPPHPPVQRPASE